MNIKNEKNPVRCAVIGIGTAIAGRRLPHLRDSVICALLLLGVFLTATGGGAGSALGCALALISGFFYAGVFAFTARSEGDSLEPFVWGNALYLVLIPLLFRDSALRAGGLSGARTRSRRRPVR